MKTKILSLFAAFMLVASATFGIGVLTQPINGFLTTNVYSQYTVTNGSVITTNFSQTGILVGTATNQIGVVLVTSTNSYNYGMASIASYSSTSWTFSGNQSNTNLWPSYGWTLYGSYPGTAYSPLNNVLVYWTGTLGVSNAAAVTATLAFAGSADGTNWVPNVLRVPLTFPIASYTPTPTTTGITNWSSQAWPYLTIQGIEDPSSTSWITNIVVDVDAKSGPGL